MKELTDDEIRMEYYSLIKSRQDISQVMMITNLGPISIDLYCGKAPKTCENFIELCESKYYNGVKFHRLIKDFMI